MSGPNPMGAARLSSPRRTWLRAGLAGAAAVLLPGCARYYYGQAAAPAGGSGALAALGLGSSPAQALLEANYAATDALLQQAPQLDPRQPVLVGTLVHIDRLEESSRLGRLCSEQIAGRLVQRGVRVTELKMRQSLAMVPGQGELLLTREVREASRAQSAQAVVVGTYAATAQSVFVGLKLVAPEGNAVIAAHDYVLPVDDNVRILLSMR
ncbi:FlgO family outer membrane protein [Acidovorax sp. GBBC 3334]|nr:FlgO family outer membrane protein [Acidovorax sp. GBBC 3334]MDA8454666.1 FlgO family outer membrane protein [Acidovorax sp. GBBC 3334]